MSHPRMRPEFARPLDVEPRAFFRALGDALARSDGACRGHASDSIAILRIRRDERRIWSPALHLHVEANGDAHDLHGRFSPSSPVWTAFVAIYLALLCIAFAAGSYGYAQLTIDETPWAFVGIPVAIALAGFTYGAAFIGQGLGAEDMYELRSFVDRIADAGPEA